MPQWLSRVLFRIRRLAAQGKVVFTGKALEELQALDLGLDERDGVEIIAGLRPRDSAGRVRSPQTDEWLYVFRPRVADLLVYVKLALRSVRVVVSCHQDRADENHA